LIRAKSDLNERTGNERCWNYQSNSILQPLMTCTMTAASRILTICDRESSERRKMFNDEVEEDKTSAKFA